MIADDDDLFELTGKRSSKPDEVSTRLLLAVDRLASVIAQSKPPSINVSPPSVNVAAPSVNVAPPTINVEVEPEIEFPKPILKWTFKLSRNQEGYINTITATAHV